MQLHALYTLCKLQWTLNNSRQPITTSQPALTEDTQQHDHKILSEVLAKSADVNHNMPYYPLARPRRK